MPDEIFSVCFPACKNSCCFAANDVCWFLASVAAAVLPVVVVRAVAPVAVVSTAAAAVVVVLAVVAPAAVISTAAAAVVAVLAAVVAPVAAVSTDAAADAADVSTTVYCRCFSVFSLLISRFRARAAPPASEG